MSVCPSAWNKSAVRGRIFMTFDYFSKICQEGSSLVNIWKEQGYLRRGPMCICDGISLNSSLNEKRFRQNL